MISVTFYKKKNEIIEITVSGHAGFADHGEDIICAAVSVLTISILNGLTEIIGRNDLNQSIKDGYTHFIIPNSSNDLQKTKTDTLIATYYLGIQGIKEAYGNYINIKEIKK
jgi:uncharacterized protein YsxB (DUF464 family)